MSSDIQEVGSYSRSGELLYVDFNKKKQIVKRQIVKRKISGLKQKENRINLVGESGAWAI